MKKHVLRRLSAVLLSVAMVVSLMHSAGFCGKAKAASTDWWKTVAGVGTTVIKAPVAPYDENAAWKGSYVWYGKYDGNPVRYRVLAPKTTTYGGTTMLLDCDTILYEVPFDADNKPNSGAQKANEWKYSDVKAGLNGSDFLTKANGFTTLEKAAIAASKVAGHKLETGSYTDGWFVNYIGLTGEKVFLLDSEDILNPKYGYTSVDGYTDAEGSAGWYETYNRIKEDALGNYNFWWLRSACSEDGHDYSGYLYYDGTIDYMCVDMDYGVSPAFNINLSSVIFTSVVSGTAGQEFAEYKLTLADSDLKIGIQSDKTLTASGSEITVPYTITGNDASKATQVSVLILDKPYTAGNTTNAKIKYYSELDTGFGNDFMTTGTGTFTLPSGLSISGWNSKYYVYLLAEDVNGIYETDYASTPLKLTAPGYPNINTQPANASVAVGNKAEFSVVAVGNGTLTYQWQRRESISSDWITFSAVSTDPTFSVTPTTEYHGYQYRCLVNDSKGRQAVSDYATLTVRPKITTQPVDKSLLVNSTAKFTVAATGKGTLIYQWQYRKNASASWANSGQQGAKTDTLLVSATAGLHGYQFRCVVTDGNGQKSYTRAATLSLKPRITTQPVNKDLLVGSTAKFTIAATGKGTLKYQWQYRKDENASWADSGQKGAKTDTLLVSCTAGLHGYQFRCIVTDGNGQKSYSNTVTLTLKPRITTQPTDKSVTAGTKAKFTVVATGKSTLTFQWQFRKNSSCEWANSGQSGNKTATLSVAATKGLNSYQFRCIVTDGNGRKTYSSIVTLTVK